MISEVFLGDNLDYMRSVPDNYFELAVVDPPYGINATNMTMGSNPNRKGRDERGELQYGNVSVAQKLKKGRLNSGGGKLKNRLLNTSDINWDNEPPPQEYFEHLFRISKNQIIFGGNYFPLPPTRGYGVWDKKQPWDNFSQVELIWTSFDCPAWIFRYSNKGGNNLETKIHPTQKPVEVYRFILDKFATQGDRIFDSHLGSGSSRIAADGFGMDFYGCERDEKYYQDQNKRFEIYKSQTKLF